MEVFPASADQRAQWLAGRSQALPTDKVELFNDFLPGILGIPDEASLAIVLHYLYHFDQFVRRYAMHALGYWPEAQVQPALERLIGERGPSDVLADFVADQARQHPEQTEKRLRDVIPYLRSDSPVLLQGALRLVRGLAVQNTGALDPVLWQQTQTAVMDATDHVLQVGESQTVSDFATLLGQLRNDRAHGILWDFVSKDVALGQATLAISWWRDSTDLPKLGALLTSPPKSDANGRELFGLPNALRDSYALAAAPYLEAALQGSAADSLKTGCARELILLGRPAGFAYVATAIEQNRRDTAFLMEWVKDLFPDLRTSEEATVLSFLQRRSK
jgi:hypothetical protein